MNASVDQLTQSLIGKNSLNECSVAELQRLAIQYPYFSPAHLLLSQKLKGEDPALYEKQFQKTSLYFQNPLWLEYLSANYIVDKSSSEVIAEEGSFTENTVQEETLNNESTEITRTEQTLIQEEPGVLQPVQDSIADQPPVEEKSDFIQQEEIQTGAEEETTEQQPIFREMPGLKIEPLSESAKALTFEPYHTVDYFASQGIRFKEEEKPVDKFGQQLKSFTEWLKAMKRLPETEVVAPPISTPDQQVEKMAEHSVIDGEVVTESMAEVWEKQGNNEKAIDIYGKLSLLNPAKSSYFAAKIEHLKHL